MLGDERLATLPQVGVGSVDLVALLDTLEHSALRWVWKCGRRKLPGVWALQRIRVCHVVIRLALAVLLSLCPSSAFSPPPCSWMRIRVTDLMVSVA